MTRHRYPTAAILADYARALLGLALTLVPLALIRLSAAVAAILAALALLFAVFAATTVKRQLESIELDADGIAARGPLSRRIAWSALDRVALRWFAPRRNRNSGFMQLVLKGDRRRIAIDSRIDGFEMIAAAAAAAAQARGLRLDDVTADNLAALGIVLDDATGGGYGTSR
jgi:hypothetical protein